MCAVINDMTMEVGALLGKRGRMEGGNRYERLGGVFTTSSDPP